MSFQGTCRLSIGNLAREERWRASPAPYVGEEANADEIHRPDRVAGPDKLIDLVVHRQEPKGPLVVIVVLLAPSEVEQA